MKYTILHSPVTIFTATNWDQSVKTLAKWIRVATITRADFGDNLGFFAVVSALGRIFQNFRASQRHSKILGTTFFAVFVASSASLSLFLLI